MPPDVGLIAAEAAKSQARKVAREVAAEVAAQVALDEAARLYAENPPADGKAGLDSTEPGPKGDHGDKGDKGDPGTDGKDGKDGRDGEDGKDGKDGIDGISAPRRMGGGGGGGSGLTVGSTQVNRLAAGTNVTINVASGVATIAASGGGGGPVAAEDITYDPAVLGETQGQAVAEALAAAVGVTVTATRVEGSTVTEDDATVLGAFVPGDVGSLIAGTGVPAGATILSVVDGVSCEMSDVGTETISDIVRITEPDPGAIGANRLWLINDASNGDNALAIRSPANTSWLALGPSYYDANGAFIGSVRFEAFGSLLALRTFHVNGTSAADVLLGPDSIRLRQYDLTGTEVAKIATAFDGEIAVTGTAFLWNGDQVAVVP